MKKSRPVSATWLYTPRATLCALGLKLRSSKLFDAIAEHVRYSAWLVELIEGPGHPGARRRRGRDQAAG